MRIAVGALYAALLIIETGCVSPGVLAAQADAPEPLCHPGRFAKSETDTLAVATACHFYHGKDYGTEAQFNPMSEIVNEGFDQLRNDFANRKISELRLEAGAHNVLEDLLHPISAMRVDGIGRNWRNELLPLSIKSTGGGQWVPNYEFHLIGSGMISERMVEWYEAHDIPHPVALSAITMMAAHFLNEDVEDGGRTVPYYRFDPVADLYVFDIGGILLFRSGRVQNFFSSNTVELTNWPVQPTLSFPGGTLENSGQEFMLRARLPRTDMFRAFFAFGISTLGGISYGPKGAVAVSVAAGADAIDNPIIDPATGRRTVTLKPNIGFFVDRDGSLLFSVTARTSNETVAFANVYPGVLRFGGHTFGLWTQALKSGRWRFGIVSSNGLGIGSNAR